MTIWLDDIYNVELVIIRVDFVKLLSEQAELNMVVRAKNNLSRDVTITIIARLRFEYESNCTDEHKIRLETSVLAKIPALSTVDVNVPLTVHTPSEFKVSVSISYGRYHGDHVFVDVDSNGLCNKLDEKYYLTHNKVVVPWD